MSGAPLWLQQYAASIAELEPGEFWLWTGLSLAASIACFVGGFLALHKARLIENTPTSRVRSAAQGYVELRGYARLMPGPEIRSPLSNARCCWWRYRVQRQESSWQNGKRTTQWRTIESGTSDELFLLADDTGDCVIDPEGGTVYPSLRRNWRGNGRRPDRVPAKTPWLQFGEYRYEEALVNIGDPLYAIGWFRSQTAHRQQDEAAEVSELLREWKADQRALLERFDANQDGQIDLQEWEAVRRAALDQIQAAHLEHALDPDLHVLSRPPDRRPFLLSTLTQEQLTRRWRISAITALLGSIALGATGTLSLIARGLL
ncbi:hypothetical protein E4T66_19510 [Sinimarinibacterium sp. CAU 1509]|uniref:GIDE domain-containing protein n=1 Tax=Sinimarinibacterium sp. CAU 1509 TaxID=2562283 RepID=UPI0010AC8783|nr:GIDE domain-containing protein [Sinimarinibacterium sp. CAU 1509]TJY56748.1 hypothetical protein E4T66_19510 [Sinimarinibacterium sp. CAU 1509]